MTPKERLLDSAGTNYDTDSSNQVVHVLVRLSDLRLVMDVVKMAEAQSRYISPGLMNTLDILNTPETYTPYRGGCYEHSELYRTDVV